jgi:hypothetical protein
LISKEFRNLSTYAELRIKGVWVIENKLVDGKNQIHFHAFNCVLVEWRRVNACVFKLNIYIGCKWWWHYIHNNDINLKKHHTSCKSYIR